MNMYEYDVFADNDIYAPAQRAPSADPRGTRNLYDKTPICLNLKSKKMLWVKAYYFWDDQRKTRGSYSRDATIYYSRIYIIIYLSLIYI